MISIRNKILVPLIVLVVIFAGASYWVINKFTGIRDYNIRYNIQQESLTALVEMRNGIRDQEVVALTYDNKDDMAKYQEAVEKVDGARDTARQLPNSIEEETDFKLRSEDLFSQLLELDETTGDLFNNRIAPVLEQPDVSEAVT